MKRTLSLILLATLLIPSAMAQDAPLKTFTLEDLIPGGKTYSQMRPQSKTFLFNGDKVAEMTRDNRDAWPARETPRYSAFTKQNNLFIRTADGEEIQVTDEPKGVVCGQAVHRNEFGIETGTFWNPDRSLLAFYRMDERMVTDYPQTDFSTRIATIVPDKYPMAGMTSHVVTVGIFNPVSRETVWLKTGNTTDRYLTNISWNPDGTKVYIIELNRDQNHAELVRYDAASGEREAVLFEERHEKYVEPQHPITFLPITKTYRNAQEVIDIAGGFIQKNTEQIQKALISPKHISNPVIIQTYTENVDRKQYEGRGGKFFLVGETVEKLMKEILTENPNSSILLLGRYGFDGFNLTRSADFEYWEKTGNVTSKTFADIEMEFMTVHRAKGLGYDNVIIINAIDSVYGFPSKIQDDPVLQYVVKIDRSIEYAEERRLFYVALTRTKNHVYIVTPRQRPSEFVRELVKDYPNVTLRGELDKPQQNTGEIKKCPICGYPLQLRYKKAYGLKLWICSNEPEICDFLTNDLRGNGMSIIKCDCCKDGYLIVKQGKNSPFLGCTNYTKDGKGCNRMMTNKEYMDLIKNMGN